MKRTIATALASALGSAAHAVALDPEGRGQGLIYPYYSVQSVSGNAFNTYLSVVNHTAQAKAVRVRVREARNSREAASFNLYLSPNDVWTGAIVPMPNTEAPRLITADRSCTLPAMTGPEPPGVNFRNDLYSGAFDDGLGSGLDRTREGWVEVIEMATLTGALGAGVTHNSTGVPVNCAVVQAPSANDIAAPTGGLSGTLTLINVSSGMDFTVNAEALADLSTSAFYRPPADPYPDFNAIEIDPVSVVVANGTLYRSNWARAADAVSAVLMRSSWMGEYVLDAGTSSRSDAVVTFPTRQFHFAGNVASAPFSACNSNLAEAFAQQPALIRWFGRETQGGTNENFGNLRPPPVSNYRCAAVSVMDFANGSPHTQSLERSGVLGSDNRAVASGQFPVGATTANGWFSVTPTSGLQLTSLGTSTRMSLANGSVTTGAHAFSGLPVVGFAVRTFVNGTLACSGGACQGNYGGSFPLKFRRAITPN